MIKVWKHYFRGIFFFLYVWSQNIKMHKILILNASLQGYYLLTIFTDYHFVLRWIHKLNTLLTPRLGYQQAEWVVVGGYELEQRPQHKTHNMWRTWGKSWNTISFEVCMPVSKIAYTCVQGQLEGWKLSLQSLFCMQYFYDVQSLGLGSSA